MSAMHIESAKYFTATNMSTPAIAEKQELSATELKTLWPSTDFCYVSKPLGTDCLSRLNAETSTSKFLNDLNQLTTMLQRFEFGVYSALGFMPGTETKIYNEKNVSLASQNYSLCYIGSGNFGSTYRLIADNDHHYALKVYYKRGGDCFTSGAWSETALGIYITAQSVRNMPHLCLANPHYDWILSQFVDSQFSSSVFFGPTYADLQLISCDSRTDLLADSNLILGAEGESYRVDYGHLCSESRAMRSDSAKLDLELKNSQIFDKFLSKEVFVKLFDANPHYRSPLLYQLATLVSEQDRLKVLTTLFNYDEVKFFPFYFYLNSGTIDYRFTRDIFNLLIEDQSPIVRSKAVFDIRGLSNEDKKYMQQYWDSASEFAPFREFIGLNY